MNLDIGKSFTFVMEDPDWVKKVAIGGLLGIAMFVLIITVIGWIPIALILLGYVVQLCRNVIAGNARPLPEWDNWGERLVDGLKAFLVSFVYSLPAAIISGAFQLPSIMASISNSATNSTPNSGVMAAVSGIGLVGSCVSWLVSILTALILPIAMGRYAATSDIGAAFQFSAIVNTFRQNASTYVVIALLTAFALPLIAGLGLIVVCIGVAFTAFYTQLVTYHLYGQAHRQAEGLNQPGYGQQNQEARPY